ncbi:ATP synthase subunit b [Novipirellula aureliae]|uniref:ATP synthase subunit b n=1 Tax=Novipirellula aureliae TaxID=2527966 RepID=A0A5C6DLP6_9BACT|nr:F0F1 ATP synthase subunit B [Novipirellula aureliae]TWU37708.1 ATP synthase subunit b [Novipirellula aureliae]
MRSKFVRYILFVVMAIALGGMSSVPCYAETSEVPHAEAAVDSHAADGDHTPPILQVDVGSAVVNIAIFLVVLAVLSFFVWPPILQGLQAREDKIHGDLEAAQKANVEARTLLESYQTKLNEASSQVQTMLAEARHDAEANSQRIAEEAKAEAEKTRVRAVADIENAKKVALTELAGQTSEIAMRVAKQVVGRELHADDHAELIRQSLDRLPSNN